MGTIAGVKAERKGHSNNRILVSKKAKALYRDEAYLEKKRTIMESEKLFTAFVREHSHPQSYPSSWAGVKT